MKQLIESQPVKVSPFVHVGYVASLASGKNYKLKGVNFFSGIIFIVVFLCLLCKFEKKILKNKNKLLIFSLTVVFSMLLYFTFSFHGYYPDEIDNENNYAKMERVMESKVLIQGIKDGTYTLQDALGYKNNMFGLWGRIDVWGNQLRIEVRDNKIIDIFTAGRDRKWNTEDDKSYLELKEIVDNHQQEVNRSKESLWARIKYFLNKNFYWGDSE